MQVREKKVQIREKKAQIRESKAQIPENKVQIPENEVQIPENEVQIPESEARVQVQGVGVAAAVPELGAAGVLKTGIRTIGDYRCYGGPLTSGRKVSRYDEGSFHRVK